MNLFPAFEEQEMDVGYVDKTIEILIKKSKEIVLREAQFDTNLIQKEEIKLPIKS